MRAKTLIGGRAKPAAAPCLACGQMQIQALVEGARDYAELNADLEKRVAERTSQLEATVNELRAKNEEIEALVAMVSHDLSEKEVLLREVYHRVKNNLQVVQSLLKMGARTLRSNDGRQAIETAVERVHVMAMVHEHLYQMPDLAGLTLSGYLRDVVEGAIASNSENPDRIRLQLEVDEIPVPLDSAIPLGLLANELVSNCLKHGIAHGGHGEISIVARKVPGAVRFVVRDDGPGLPENFDVTKCTSMGLKLAANLTLQLGGRLTFTSRNGCHVQADLTRLCPQPQLCVERESAPQPAASMHPAPAPWIEEPGQRMEESGQPRETMQMSSREFNDPSYYLS